MRLAFLTLLIAIAGCGGATTGSGSDVDASGGSTAGGGSSQTNPAAGGAESSAGGASAGGAGGGSAGGTSVATLCPGAGWSSATQAVAVGLYGADVVVVSADGSQRVVATLGQSAGIAASEMYIAIESAGDGALVWTWWLAPGSDHTDGETVLLDHAGQVIWQLPGEVVHTSANLPLATTAGMVASSLGKGKLVRADGTISDLPLGDPDSVYYLGELQSDGWFAAMWTNSLEQGPDGVEWHHGFVNLDGRPTRELAAKPATEFGVRSDGGQVYYLTDPVSLFLETPTEARSIALGIDGAMASTFNASRSTSRFVVSVDQRLAAIVEPVSGTVSAIDSAALDAMAGTDSLGNPQWYEVAITRDSDFVLGSNYGTPLFMLDSQTGTGEPVRLDLLAPLGPLDGSACGDTLVLDDGRIGLGLRDSALAGFYVGKADGSDFERLGLPFRDVTAIGAHHVADSWVLTGVSGIDTYCVQHEPFVAPPSNAAPVLEGDAVQIIAPGAEPLVLPEPAAFVMLDTTGLCAVATWPAPDPASNEVRVYDVMSGNSTVLDGVTNVIWL